MNERRTTIANVGGTAPRECRFRSVFSTATGRFVRISLVLVVLELLLVAGCSEERIPVTGPDEPKSDIVPVEVTAKTRGNLADLVTSKVADGWNGAMTESAVELGQLTPDLADALIFESGSAELVGVRIRPEALEGTARVGSEDLELFRVREGANAGVETVRPQVSEGDERLRTSVGDLLDFLDVVGVEVGHLRDAWNRTVFHDADKFPGGLPPEVDGTTFLWTGDFPVFGFLNWWLLWWDERHHIVLAGEHALHLRAGDFDDLGDLTIHSEIVLRELAKIVIHESSCADTANRNRLAESVRRVLTGAFGIGASVREEETPSTADVLDYHLGLLDMLETNGIDCAQAFGFPVAGSASLEAPSEVPAGAPFDVSATFLWPDGRPLAGEFVVLIVEGRDRVLLTDAAGVVTATFRAPDAAGRIEARAAGLGASASTPIEVVAGDSAGCCLPDGSCRVLFPKDCMQLDGTPLSVGTPCSPDACEDYGACCAAGGVCVLRTLEECAESGGRFLGAHVPCDPNACPPNGACCLPDGSCIITNPAGCEGAQGTFQNEGTTCDTDPCSFGACCFADGTCLQRALVDCENLEGTWQGPGTSCERTPCAAPGACCSSDGSCVVVLGTECIGQFLGDGSACDPNPCPQPGACCDDDGGCRVSLPGECHADFLPSSVCDPNPCAQPGACCQEDGSCVVALESGCDGGFQGGGTVCQPNPCPQPPTGACCWAGHTRCTIRTEASCRRELAGDYLGDGTVCFPEPCVDPEAGACCFDHGCLYLDPVTCADGGGTFFGAGVPCTDEICPDPATGACCFETGNCQVRTEDGCTRDGGAYLGDEVACDPNPCAGACCFPSGVCLELPEGDCVPQGGEYLGDGTSCDPNPCSIPRGACCVGDGSCEVSAEEDCSESDGTYLGDETACEPDPCPARGACCLADGACTVLTLIDCETADGIYRGDDIACDPDPCTRDGACCDGQGGCQVLPFEECEDSGGAYQGDDVACSSDACPKRGPCCMPDGLCQIRLADECVQSGGEPGEPGLECTPNPCPGTGACCVPDLGCRRFTLIECEQRLGVYQGDLTDCTQGCPVEACCLPDGSCEVLTNDDCRERGGVSSNGPCDDRSCDRTGACCRPDGTCYLVPLEEVEGCQRSGGEFLGQGTVCDPDPCPPFGACCDESGDCEVVVELLCDFLGRTYQGDGSVCDPNPCPADGACCSDGDCSLLPAPECAGDFLGVGTLCSPNPCADGSVLRIPSRVGRPHGISVARRSGRGGLLSTGRGSFGGNGPGDLWIAGSSGVRAHNSETGTDRGPILPFPIEYYGAVHLDAPVPLEGTDIKTWAFCFGPNGVAQRPWDSQLGWLSTYIAAYVVLDACAYDDRADAAGFIYTGFQTGYVVANEFDDNGHLLSVWSLAGVPGSTGNAISAFARTAPGGQEGGEVLVVTHGEPGQLWQPDRLGGGETRLVGNVGNDPRVIRAEGEVAVVSNFGSDEITLIHWPYGGTATITGTLSVGEGPVGVSMASLPSGNVLAVTSGFEDDTITLTVLSPTASVVSNETVPAPSGCEAPAFVAVTDGVELRLVVSCHASEEIVILPIHPE